MGANVLVGIQVPEKDKEEFAARISTLGYKYENERLLLTEKREFSLRILETKCNHAGK